MPYQRQRSPCLTLPLPLLPPPRTGLCFFSNVLSLCWHIRNWSGTGQQLDPGGGYRRERPGKQSASRFGCAGGRSIAVTLTRRLQGRHVSGMPRQTCRLLVSGWFPVWIEFEVNCISFCALLPVGLVSQSWQRGAVLASIISY